VGKKSVCASVTNSFAATGDDGYFAALVWDIGFDIELMFRCCEIVTGRKLLAVVASMKRDGVVDCCKVYLSQI
jgi:hypothetical protein